MAEFGTSSEKDQQASVEAMTTILHILQHALGRDQYGIQRKNGGVDWCNHYTASEQGDSIATCREAAALGFMTEHAPSVISGGDFVFVVTAKGVDHVALNSPPEPKVSRGKRRYLQWLNESDYNNEKFGDWLKRKSAETRAYNA
jgi:hypothetical protein